MSFDVFFQSFHRGAAGAGGGPAAARVLAPHVARREQRFILIKYGDGQADVYLDERAEANGMMANHISARDPWDLLVDAAKAADWVILPVGCPTCMTHDDQRDHLPEELQTDVVLVRSGADLLAAIRRA